MSPTSYFLHPTKVAPDGCISLVGMAAAGKTTIGRELATFIGWPQLDCDHVIESTYGTRLQNIADSLDKESFLDLEGQVISSLNIRRCIISTGGSAIYRGNAITHLKSMGPIIYIEVSLPVILERIARKPERGIAMAPGQTLEDLYYERSRLYEKAADFTVTGGQAPASEYAAKIAAWLSEQA